MTGDTVTWTAGFWHAVRAEWVKLRSVRRWTFGAVLAVALTVGLGLLAASESESDANNDPTFALSPTGAPVIDTFPFTHQALTGDGEIVVHIAEQTNAEGTAVAGVMVKQSIEAGSAYAALMRTPTGVRLRANFHDKGPDLADRNASWLKLARRGTTMTGWVATDGTDWQRIGSVNVPGLTPTVEVGMFVTAPMLVKVVREAGGTSSSSTMVMTTATFDSAWVDTAQGRLGTDWVASATGRAGDTKSVPIELDPGAPPAGITVTGAGLIAPFNADDDVVQNALAGVLTGIIAVMVVGALFITTEFRHRLIRTTFAASPRRGRVLAAKAVVLGAAAFAVGLVAAGISLVSASPVQRRHGFGPPVYPPPSLADPAVWRVLLTTAAFVAAVALLALGLGAVFRHGAAAIAGVLGLVILPTIVSAFLPLGPAQWLMRLTPAGGFSTQRLQPPTPLMAEAWASIGWASGLTAAVAYAGAALLAAYWVLRRRDA